MLIEIYKGVSIFHDAAKDEFYTSVCLSPKGQLKKEYIRAGRLGKIRSDIDKYISVIGQKPLMPKAWARASDSEEEFQLVEVVSFNALSQDIIYRKKGDSKTETRSLEGRYGRDVSFYLSCKENDLIVVALNKKAAEIKKIRDEKSCSSGKLIPLKPEHFV